VTVRGSRVRVRQGVEGGEMVGKGLDLDICPGAAAEFLVTPACVGVLHARSRWSVEG